MSIMTPDPSSSEHAKALKERIRFLSTLKDAVSQTKASLIDEIEEIKLDIERPERRFVMSYAIPRFVELLEKANHYFDFKENALRDTHFSYAKSDTEIYQKLLDQQQQANVSTLSKHALKNVSKAIFNLVVRAKDPTKDVQSMKGLDPALHDHIHWIVYKARKNHYVMDQDPMEELDKMLTRHTKFYDDYFLNGKRPLNCVKRSRKEAVEDYSQFVSKMLAMSRKVALKKRKKSTATVARNKKTCIRQEA